MALEEVLMSLTEAMAWSGGPSVDGFRVSWDRCTMREAWHVQIIGGLTAGGEKVRTEFDAGRPQRTSDDLETFGSSVVQSGMLSERLGGSESRESVGHSSIPP